MKVAIGIDGTELANQAVGFAGRLLSPKVDDLMLYYSPPEFQLSSKSPVSPHALSLAATSLANGVFELAKGYLPPEMESVTSTMRSDRLPADGLVDLAEENEADLVVVGSHSAKRKFPFLLGSTARTVVHQTTRPVMVVRGRPLRDVAAMNVLIACDEQPWGDNTNVLRNLSWPEDTTSTLFHVTEAYDDEFIKSVMTHGSANVPNSTSMVREYQAAIDARKLAASARLESLKQQGPAILRDATVQVEQGDVVDELLEKIERDNIDLVVLSSRKSGVIDRLLGSVTESMLTRCPCSLLIVHATKSGRPLGKSAEDEAAKHAVN